MLELKKLSTRAIEAALHKAEQYRLLNEPRQAESICLDVLDVDDKNQRALVLLILARTDQFRVATADMIRQVLALVPRLEDEYERTYYEGIVYERWAKAMLTRNRPGSGPRVYELLGEAMQRYEAAETLSPPDNNDPILRWNSCARLVNRHDHVEPAEPETFHPLLE